MGQLFSAFGVSWSLLIAQVINFAIVVVALWYLLYKPVIKMLAKRQEMLIKSVEDAKKAEEIFAGASDEADKRIKSADEKAGEIVNSARLLAEVEKLKMIKEAEDRADAIAKEAEMKAEEARREAHKENEKEIARLAVLTAEKILKEKND